MTRTMFLWQWGSPSQTWPCVCWCNSVLPQHCLWKLIAKKVAPGTRVHILPKLFFTVHERARALNCSPHIARHPFRKKCWRNMKGTVVNEGTHNAEQSPEPRIISWTSQWEVLSRVFLRKPVSPTVTKSLKYFWIYSGSIYLHMYSSETLQAQQNLSCPYISSYYLKAGVHANAL